MLQLSPKEILRHQVFPEARGKKLGLVSAISTPVTEVKEEAELVEAAEPSKDGEKSKGKYLENLAQVFITF